jgi:hypothetical protein
MDGARLESFGGFTLSAMKANSAASGSRREYFFIGQQ